MLRLRTTGGLAAARTGDPQSIRVTRAPEAPRPLRRIPKNRTGEGRSLAHANADAGAGATTPSACFQHPQRRRWSATRGLAVPSNCACGAHVVCVLWWCSRPGRAPRRTSIAAEAIECFSAQWQPSSMCAFTMYSSRALWIAGVARADNDAAGECILVGCRFGGSICDAASCAARRWRPEQGQRQLLRKAPRQQRGPNEISLVEVGSRC